MVDAPVHFSANLVLSFIQYFVKVSTPRRLWDQGLDVIIDAKLPSNNRTHEILLTYVFSY